VCSHILPTSYCLALYRFRYRCTACRKPVAEFVKEIRALKPADLTAAVAKLLKSQPSMAVLGDIAHVPRYDEVAKRFA
jgi:predicted Zn-dependent peptidase